MNHIQTRICIRTKDICNITGYSERQARNIINDIKVFFKKQKHQPVTVTEFSKFMNIPIEEVKSYLV